jgi:hypothetical protein
MSSRDLDRLLATWRDQTRAVQAPQRVEAALLRAFRAQAPGPVRRRWLPWAWGAAAAVFLVIGGAAWKLNKPIAPMPAVKLAMAPPPVIVQPGLPKAAQPIAAKRVKRSPPPAVQTANVAHPPAQEVATDFLPLEDSVSLPPIESGHILRVQLPRSTMMRFGFPVNPDRMMEPVKADVVFAQDGIARAVRFVR